LLTETSTKKTIKINYISEIENITKTEYFSVDKNIDRINTYKKSTGKYDKLGLKNISNKLRE